MAMIDTRLAGEIKTMLDTFEQQAIAGQTSENMKNAISLELAQKIINEVRQMTIVITANAGATPVTFTNISIT